MSSITEWAEQAGMENRRKDDENLSAEFFNRLAPMFNVRFQFRYEFSIEEWEELGRLQLPTMYQMIGFIRHCQLRTHPRMTYNEVIEQTYMADIRRTRRRFEVRDDGGEVIPMTSCSSRINHNTTLEWILPYVAKKLSWPSEYVNLTSKGAVVAHVHEIRNRTQTFMSNLDPASPLLTIYARKLRRPELFDLNHRLCLCDFDGCCRQCAVPGRLPCRGCGNNGCCRTGNCGHACCERNDNDRFRFLDWCRFKGCRPRWASRSADHGGCLENTLAETESLPAGWIC